MKDYRALVSLFVLCPGVALAQHPHINAGAIAPEPGSKLYFVNGALFATNSGFLLNMTLATNGVYSNLYRGSITFTALPASPLNGGPAFGHAAPGAHLELELLSVDGPAGSTCGFWEQDDETGETSLESEFQDGVPSPAMRVGLSENDGSPGSDPYGHIHGRQFTTTRPGLHVLNLRILDASSNGRNGGPIHPPSDPLSIYLQAGVSIHGLRRDNTRTTVLFGGPAGVNYVLETTQDLGPAASWKSIDGPVSGTGKVGELVDPDTSGSTRFYRIRGGNR